MLSTCKAFILFLKVICSPLVLASTLIPTTGFKSTRAFNKILSQIGVPSSKAASTISVIDFMKLVLGKCQKLDDFPPPPTTAELSSLSNELVTTNLSPPPENTYTLEEISLSPSGRQKTIPLVFYHTCHQDAINVGVPRLCLSFNMEHRDWNQRIIQHLTKHYCYAHKYQAFDQYHIDHSEEIIKFVPLILE